MPHLYSTRGLVKQREAEVGYGVRRFQRRCGLFFGLCSVRGTTPLALFALLPSLQDQRRGKSSVESAALHSPASSHLCVTIHRLEYTSRLSSQSGTHSGIC